MRPWIKGLIIAAVQVSLVTSVALKLLYERATQPRVWVLTIPYDPNLPIRGRYVSLQIVVEPQGIQEKKAGTAWDGTAVILKVEGDRLVAEKNPLERQYDPAGLHVLFIDREGEKRAVLDKRLAFFIPEHLPDPSLRPLQEELWLEVTVPKQGPPRPIRLGIKRGAGPILPLQLQ